MVPVTTAATESVTDAFEVEEEEEQEVKTISSCLKFDPTFVNVSHHSHSVNNILKLTDVSKVKDYDTEIALKLRQDVDFSHEGGSRKETVDDDGNIQVKTSR